MLLQRSQNKTARQKLTGHRKCIIVTHCSVTKEGQKIAADLLAKQLRLCQDRDKGDFHVETLILGKVETLEIDIRKHSARRSAAIFQPPFVTE